MRLHGLRGVVHVQTGEILDQVDDFGDVSGGCVGCAGYAGFETLV